MADSFKTSPVPLLRTAALSALVLATTAAILPAQAFAAGAPSEWQQRADRNGWHGGWHGENHPNRNMDERGHDRGIAGAPQDGNDYARQQRPQPRPQIARPERPDPRPQAVTPQPGHGPYNQNRGYWNRDGQRGNPNDNAWNGNRNGNFQRNDDNRGHDRRGDENPYRDRNARGNYDPGRNIAGRYDNNRHYDNNRRWDRDNWRRDNRYDWRSYRSRHGSAYRIGRYYAPYRGYDYRRVGVGISLGPLFYSQRYWISDPWAYRLPPADGPYRWVRYYDDVLLVNIYDGDVVDVIYGFFW